ncbi:MAG: hypothetical protein ACKPBA_13680 [Planctomycetota bacterium]
MSRSSGGTIDMSMPSTFSSETSSSAFSFFTDSTPLSWMALAFGSMVSGAAGAFAASPSTFFISGKQGTAFTGASSAIAGAQSAMEATRAARATVRVDMIMGRMIRPARDGRSRGSATICA